MAEFLGKSFGARFGGADEKLLHDLVSQGMLGNLVVHCMFVCMSVGISSVTIHMLTELCLILVLSVGGAIPAFCDD